MWKRVICILLAALLLGQALSASAVTGAYGFTLQYDNGIISMSYESRAVKAVCTLTGNDMSTYTFEHDLSRGPQFGLPVRQIGKGMYEIEISFYDAAGKLLETCKGGPAQIGVSSPIPPLDNEGTPGLNDPSRSRAIMQPYAKVYATSSLTGEPVAELKRHDIVNVVNISGNVAQVNIIIQSGDGTISNAGEVDAIYNGEGDKVISNGYIDVHAFELADGSGSAFFDLANLQREVAELAYSRLGIRGVYSQARRYQDYYLDCAALATWCWYQVGVDMSNGGTGGTNCTGLIGWADSMGDDYTVWKAEISHDAAAAEIQAYKDSFPSCSCDRNGGSCSCSSIDPITGSSVPDCDCNFTPDALRFGESKYGPIGEEDLITYTTSVDADVYASLQPGDLIFFNYMESLTCQYEDWIPHTFQYRVNETEAAGYEHVGVFVGLKDANTATIIESSSPSTNPNKNTKVTQMRLGSEKAMSIGRIVRPCGVSASTAGTSAA